MLKTSGLFALTALAEILGCCLPVAGAHWDWLGAGVAIGSMAIIVLQPATRAVADYDHQPQHRPSPRCDWTGGHGTVP